MAVKIQVKVFWVLTPGSVVVGHQHFRGTCYLHLHPADGGSMWYPTTALHGITTYKT